MKKIFTLAVFAMLALAANAKVDLGLFSPWGSTCVQEGSTYTFNGSWAGAGLWLGTDTGWYDATGNDYVVLVYENHTGADINFGVCYNHWEKTESWGDVYTTVSMPIDQEKGYTAIKLDKTSVSDGGKTYYEEIRQLQIQDNGQASSVTVNGVYLMTEDEYKALQEGEPMGPKVKEFTIPAKFENGVVVMAEGEDAAGWYDFGWLGLENLPAQGYNTFVVEVASAKAAFQVLAQNWPSGEQIVKGYDSIEGPVTVIFPLAEGVQTGLGQFALQNMNKTDTWMDPTSGKEVSWYDANEVVVTRAYITSEVLEDPTGIKETTVAAKGNNVMYNIAGQRINKANGLYIVNGKKYFAK